MTIDLTDTTTGAILEALTQARRRLGGPASGMVLTLIIVTDEAAQYDAVRAASQAGREHPSRVLAVITRKSKAESPLDAQVRVGDTGPCETVPVRMYAARGVHLVARRDADLAPRGLARRGRPAPGHGGGGQRGAQGDAAGPGHVLPAG